MENETKPTPLLLLRDLTKGEKLHLYRRRLGFTQIQMSVDYGVSLNEYRAMEMDMPEARTVYVSLGTLEEREVYTVLRIRSGLSREEVASEVGVSTYWLRQMEAGAAPLKRLQEYWREVA